ncbi:MAG: CinA family protein [Candidatus Porifericomitaceae bacterium WSBS_2022_MAG_OTU9]
MEDDKFMEENMAVDLELDMELMEQSERIAGLLLGRGLLLAVAESCTAGAVSYVLTSVDGSSSWFDRGFVVYSNKAKTEMLGVGEDILVEHGAVSEPVALAMASGACANSDADMAVAITGIAGPTGGNADKPVGTVWIAGHRKSDDYSFAIRHQFKGDRKQVRLDSCMAAIVGIEKLL